MGAARSAASLPQLLLLRSWMLGSISFSAAPLSFYAGRAQFGIWLGPQVLLPAQESRSTRHSLECWRTATSHLLLGAPRSSSSRRLRRNVYTSCIASSAKLYPNSVRQMIVLSGRTCLSRRL